MADNEIDSIDFHSTQIWQMAMELAGEVFNLRDALPQDDSFLQNELPKVVVSIPSLIAESFATETYDDQLAILKTVRSSLIELETTLLLCMKNGMLSEGDLSSVMELIIGLGDDVDAMIEDVFDQIDSMDDTEDEE